MATPDQNDQPNTGAAIPHAHLDRISGPELFFGLIGPIGTNLALVSQVLMQELAEVQYKSTLVKLSDLIRGVKKYSSLPTAPADEKWSEHMRAGTEFRQTLERGDAVTLLAIGKLVIERKFALGDKEYGVLPRHAFVIHQLKRPEEIDTLRRIYGKAFIAISAYEPRAKRIDAISAEIARSRNDSDRAAYRHRAEELVRRDEDEQEQVLGQDVTDAYPKADLFVQADVRSHIKERIGRFVEILFGYPFHTPTKDEFGMFCAKAASLRSSALGRQVGLLPVRLTPA